MMNILYYGKIDSLASVWAPVTKNHQFLTTFWGFHLFGLTKASLLNRKSYDNFDIYIIHIEYVTLYLAE